VKIFPENLDLVKVGH